MKLLAVDTATSSCSVALFDDERLMAEALYTAGPTHSRRLLAIIDRMLEDGGYRPTDIDRIAATRGPGTFTGLRIGLSTVKGLAAAIGAPVVGVSSLAALAFPLRLLERPVAAMIDARRGEVYHVLYRTGAVLTEAAPPVKVSRPEVVAAGLPADAVLVGSGAAIYRTVFESRCPGIRFADSVQHVIRAASVGLLAMARFGCDDVDAVESLNPDYIRPSDAQIQMRGT